MDDPHVTIQNNIIENIKYYVYLSHRIKLSKDQQTAEFSQKIRTAKIFNQYAIQWAMEQ